jgi:hypothetical protein
MDYLNGVDDSYGEDEAFDRPNRKTRLQRNLGIFAVVLGLLGTTFAANITLNGGQRKEFGQGIFQIKACDQWVGIGLTAGSGSQNAYVKNLKLYGFDPRLCLGRVFRIKLFATGNANSLNLYLDESSTAGFTDTATSLALLDTSTAYSSSYPIYPDYTPYQSWASDAVTINNKWGKNIGWGNGYLYIDYTLNTGVYTIVFTTPLAVVSQVTSVTIESAKYS